jgi:hypothetical protein
MGEPIVSKMSQTVMKHIQANYMLQQLQNHKTVCSDIDWPAYDRWKMLE